MFTIVHWIFIRITGGPRCSTLQIALDPPWMAVFEWARVTVTDKVNRCKYLNLNFERRNMLVPWDHATSIIEMVFEGLIVFVCIS